LGKKAFRPRKRLAPTHDIAVDTQHLRGDGPVVRTVGKARKQAPKLRRFRIVQRIKQRTQRLGLAHGRFVVSQNTEVWKDAQQIIVFAHNARTKAVEGGNIGCGNKLCLLAQPGAFVALRSRYQAAGDALAHFGRGCLGKRHNQHASDVRAPANQPEDAFGQHAGLAAARRRRYNNMPAVRLDGSPLLVCTLHIGSLLYKSLFSDSSAIRRSAVCLSISSTRRFSLPGYTSSNRQMLL
jgi:hypothetical protein